MGSESLEALSERIARVASRRQVLARGTAWAAGGLAALIAPAFARAAPPTGVAPTGSIVVLDRGPDAGLAQTVCGIYCQVVDCCTNGCCQGLKLFKCTSRCDGSFFYICSSPCTSFCYSQAC